MFENIWRGKPLEVSDPRSFARVETLETLAKRDLNHDARMFENDPGRWVAMTPQGLAKGETVFGTGSAPPMTATSNSRTWMNEVVSWAVDSAVYFPVAGAVVARDGRIVRSSVENAGYFGGLEFVDPLFERRDGRLYLAPGDVDVQSKNISAIAPLGLGYDNYGHFLFDGVPGALLLAQAPALRDAVIVTPKLNTWQHEIVSLAGLNSRILEIDQPTAFETVYGTTLTSLHVSYTGRYCRPLFDMLRFSVSWDRAAPERIYIRRPLGSPRRMLNESDLIEHLTARGFTVVQPEKLSVQDQIRLFSNARVVIGQTGAALANVGFSPLGCEVIEIMPECYFDQWIRSVCRIFGHTWRVVFAPVPEARRTGIVAGGREHPAGGFSFEVEIDEVANSIERAERHLIDDPLAIPASRLMGN